MDKKKKQILILVAIASLITLSGVVLAINGNWFTFTLTPDLTTPGVELQNPFTITELPEYLLVSVTLKGSGNTGMEHEVLINIGHNRPSEEGFWEASASYVLALKQINGTLADPIDSNFFTGLREHESYLSSLIWTPSANASGYQMVLDITEVTWNLVVETATFVDTLFELEAYGILDADNVLLNGEPLPAVLLTGDTVSMEWTISNGHTGAITKIKYYVAAQIGENPRTTLIPELVDFISVTLPLGGEYTISDTFTAPTSGSYILILVITEASSG